MSSIIQEAQKTLADTRWDIENSGPGLSITLPAATDPDKVLKCKQALVTLHLNHVDFRRLPVPQQKIRGVLSVEYTQAEAFLNAMGTGEKLLKSENDQWQSPNKLSSTPYRE